MFEAFELLFQSILVGQELLVCLVKIEIDELALTWWWVLRIRVSKSTRELVSDVD